MGVTQRNIYLFPSLTKKELVAGIRKHFKADGYKAVRGEEGFDVTARLYCRKGKPCFMVLDEEGGGDARTLPASLAVSLGCDVLIADVYDSDYLELTYTSKAKEEAAVLAVGYSYELDEFVKEGDITVLHPILKEEGSASQLDGIWESVIGEEDGMDIIDGLSAILGLLGCDEDPIDFGEARVMRFQKVDPKERGYEIVRNGPPKLSILKNLAIIINNYPPPPVYYSVIIESIGGPSKGFSVVLAGEMAELAATDPNQYESVEVFGYKDPSILSDNDNEPEQFNLSAKLYPYKTTDGTTCLRADFPDTQIHKGILIDDEKRYSSIRGYGAFVIYLSYLVTFKLRMRQVEGSPKLPLMVRIHPISNWDEGYAETERMMFINASDSEKNFMKPFG
ncbi:MAG: hypothetical protein FWH40_09790 [Coriobacteriia bacterium]|nr:hypothetical protein [Coriobacteriia bacterium]